MSKMVPTHGPLQSMCLVFSGYKNRDGYGKLRHEGAMTLSHRLSYKMFMGEIPNGMVLDHLCRNTGCCNPHHLEPVTHGENIRRGDHHCRRKTHCKHGHEYTVENTYRYVRSDGGRDRGCKICRTRAAMKSQLKTQEVKSLVLL